MIVYDRGGTSNLVRPFAVEGFSNGCGLTRSGASKPLTAFRSSPVNTCEAATRVFAVSSHTTSTWRDFDRSRFRMNNAVLPSPGLIVAAASMYATAFIWGTSYVGDSISRLSTLPRAYCSAQLYGW